MSLLATALWISEKTLCMMEPGSADPPAPSPAFRRAGKAGPERSGSILSWICGMVPHLAFLLHIYAAITTQLPVLFFVLNCTEKGKRRHCTVSQRN